MKKITRILTLVSVFISLSLANVSPAFAEESPSFPYEGIYVTDVDRAVHAYIFAPNSIYLIYNRDSYPNQRNSERIFNLLNFKTEALTSTVNPAQSAEEIEAMREDLGLNTSLKEKLAEILEELPEDATFQDFEIALDGQFQRIEFGSHLFNQYFADHIKLTKPQIDLRNEDEWVVRMFQQRIFSIKPGPEEGTIVDDYKGVYRKADDIFQIQNSEVGTHE